MNIPRRVRSGVAASLACALILMLAPSVLAAGAAKAPKFPWEGPALRVKAGRLVVTFQRGTSASQKRSIHSAAGGEVVSRGRAGVIDVVRLPRGRSSLAAIRAYEADPNVVAAEPDRFAVPAAIPNDPHFPTQWGLHNTGQMHPITESGYVAKNNHSGTAGADVDAPEAWDAATADAPGPADDVVVAVIDTGVDVDHPDLADAMWVNPDEIPMNGVDDDANGKIDDINGWDFKGNDANPSPAKPLDESHGTHVAGVVAAEPEDATGIAGVCQACRIM